MRAIATLLILVVLISVSVPAQAGGKDWLGVGLAGLILLLGGGNNDNAACVRQQPIQPEAVAVVMRPTGSLGDVVIRDCSGPDSAQFAVTDILTKTGWRIINDSDREAGEQERQRYGTAGSSARVTHYAHITTQFHDGRLARRWNRNGGSSTEEDVREIICVVDLNITEISGATVATARGIGSSWSQFSNWSWSGRHWGYSQETFTPQQPDVAFWAALIRACNQVSGQRAGQAAQATATPQVKPCIAEIRDGFIYINLGSAQGVQEGDRFDVMGGEPIKDPNTGEVLGALAKCQIRVDRVLGDRLSRCDLVVDDYPGRLCKAGDPIAPVK